VLTLFESRKNLNPHVREILDAEYIARAKRQSPASSAGFIGAGGGVVNIVIVIGNDTQSIKT
jgi:hypothetical protein